MTLGKYNLGALAAAALIGSVVATSAVLSAGHSDPRALGEAVLLGAVGGLMSGLMPPHNADGSLSPAYAAAENAARSLGGVAGTVAGEVLHIAENLPAGTAVAAAAAQVPVPAPAPAVAAPDPEFVAALQAIASKAGLTVSVAQAGS